MATTPSTFIWEFGIDWKASIKSAFTCYMPGAFIVGDAVKRTIVSEGDKITFRIFNLTKVNPQHISIQSFTINPQPGAFGAFSINRVPFDKLQPPLLQLPPPHPPLQLPLHAPSSQPSTFFGGSHPCWEFQPVTVAPPDQRFLLSFWVQAANSAPPSGEPNLLTFIQDPEMIVGEN